MAIINLIIAISMMMLYAFGFEGNYSNQTVVEVEYESYPTFIQCTYDEELDQTTVVFGPNVHLRHLNESEINIYNAEQRHNCQSFWKILQEEAAEAAAAEEWDEDEEWSEDESEGENEEEWSEDEEEEEYEGEDEEWLDESAPVFDNSTIIDQNLTDVIL